MTQDRRNLCAEAGARALLRTLFEVAVAAADPAALVSRHLPPRPARLLVVGAGKAASQMAAAVEAAYEGTVDGFVITRYGHAVPTRSVVVAQAGHPVPDEAGLAATRELVGRVAGTSPDTLVLALMSGGGSSLLCAPGSGIAFDEKRRIGDALLRSGAGIGEINTVRKHLSAVKGGRLAAVIAPRPCLTLVLSDVPGDDPALVASGPTLPDFSEAGDALRVLERYAVAVSPSARCWLERGGDPRPRAGDAVFRNGRTALIGSPGLSLRAAAERGRALGLSTMILSDEIEGEAGEVGRVHAAIARSCAAGTGPLRPPCLILSGGETSVTVRGAGRGGRNGEFLLGLAAQLDGHPGISAIACDTDGIDGSQNNAGAVVTPSTPERAKVQGLDLALHRRANNSHGFFEALGDLVVTGPTGTNVNDFRAMLVMPQGA